MYAEVQKFSKLCTISVLQTPVKEVVYILFVRFETILRFNFHGFLRTPHPVILIKAKR